MHATVTEASRETPTATSTESAGLRAYHHLKRSILSGELPGGTLLTEGAVAHQLDISRTPVREALQRLRAEDFVELYPKKGALVLAVDATEMRDVFEARQLIEEWAAAKAWPRRRELLAPLGELLRHMEAARKAEDSAGFSEADREFHEVVVEAAGNAVITRQYRHLRDRQLLIVAAQMRADTARMTSAIRAHRGLLELLESGTKASFVRRSREHVIDAAARVAGR